MKKISLIELAYKRAGLALAVMILTLGINLWVIHRHIHEISATQGERALNQYAQNISQQLHFYRSVLRRLALQSEVQNIMVMNDAASAQTWP